MTTITEDYCDFETAKLLKEKGFDCQCRDFYRQENGNWLHRNTYEYNYFNLQMPIWKDCYACPTLQMAMKWLREVHNIHISVYVFNRELPITNVPIFYTCDIATEKLSSQQGHLRGAWKSYEEACESALKYCLEHLI